MRNYTDKELVEKMLANSFWKTYIPNHFYWYSAEEQKKVTEIGKKVLLEMMKQFPDIIL